MELSDLGYSDSDLEAVTRFLCWLKDPGRGEPPGFAADEARLVRISVRLRKQETKAIPGGGDDPPKTPGEKELRAAEVAEKYGMSKGQISKATRLPPDDPMHLACRHEGRNVFIRESVAKKWATNYEARRDGRQRSDGVLGETKNWKALLTSVGEQVNRSKEAE